MKNLSIFAMRKHLTPTIKQIYSVSFLSHVFNYLNKQYLYIVCYKYRMCTYLHTFTKTGPHLIRSAQTYNFPFLLRSPGRSLDMKAKRLVYALTLNGAFEEGFAGFTGSHTVVEAGRNVSTDQTQPLGRCGQSKLALQLWLLQHPTGGAARHQRERVHTPLAALHDGTVTAARV